MGRCLALSLLALLVWAPALTQEGFSEVREDTTSLYIRTFGEKITVRASLSNTGNSFLVRSPEDDINLLLEPGTKNYLGLSVLFRSIELDFGFSPGFLNEPWGDADPKLFNLNFRIFMGPWMQTLNLYSQRGFFADVNGVRNYLTGFHTVKLGGSTSYIFNPDFSFRAVGFQNEWQLKSAGSFLPRLSVFYTHYHFRGEEESITNSWDVTAGPGYYYNWVIGKHYILGAGNSTGVGIRYQRDVGETDYGSLVLDSEFRVAVGFNSEHFFTGANFNYSFLKQRERDGIRLNDKIHYLEFYIGYRFNAPEKWVQAADKINRKFGWD